MRRDHRARQGEHRELLAMTQQLIAEYAGIVPAASVVAAVAQCREQLLASGIERGLVPATEAAVRCSLGSKLPVHTP